MNDELVSRRPIATASLYEISLSRSTGTTTIRPAGTSPIPPSLKVSASCPARQPRHCGSEFRQFHLILPSLGSAARPGKRVCAVQLLARLRFSPSSASAQSWTSLPKNSKPLSPDSGAGVPLLQIADFLVNGAGFSRRLAEPEADDRPLIIHLIRSVLDDPDDQLVRAFFAADHRHECGQACYRCLQRYGNRGYHGLLDWRLGLGFLRSMLDPCRFGLDGNWSAFRELEDWPRLAQLVAEELVRINPAQRQRIVIGRDQWTAIRKQNEYYIIVHPFWRLSRSTLASEPFSSAIAATNAPLDRVFYIDAFDAARRPVKALDIAKLRPLDE